MTISHEQMEVIIEPRKITNIRVMLADLKECCRTHNLQRGKKIHAEAVEFGYDSSIYIGNSLIDMYAKCGSMEDARRIFDKIKHPTVVSWNLLILGYADNGLGLPALVLFTRMKNVGPAPNRITILAALKACTSLASKEGPSRLRNHGKDIHDFALLSGFGSDIYIQNTLIQMYAKCGSMEEARRVFDSVKYPGVVSWNVLILGYVENGQGVLALDLLTRMQSQGPAPNCVTFMAALKACNDLHSVKRRVHQVKKIHDLVVENGDGSDIYVQNTLIDMYAKSGSMAQACEVFDSMKHPTVVSWNVLILGYTENKQCLTALDMFKSMRSRGPAPNYLTFVAAIKACTSLQCRNKCKGIYYLVVENGFDSCLHVQSTLIDMYAKCGSMVDACQVFDITSHPDVVCWNALILGYANNGQGLTALDLFTMMKNAGPIPNSVTFVAALKACTTLCNEGRDRGKEIHDLVVASGGDSDIYVGNTLIDMYAKCGDMVAARQVFDRMNRPDVVSWNVLIMGYAENGQGLTALELFTRMRVRGLSPDSVTFLAALKACGLVGGLELGREIHLEIDRDNGLDVVLVNCLVDFYAKCGSLLEAQSVFDLHHKARNLITWTALLAGFSGCGDHERVFRLFEEMQDAGFQPNSVTFLSILIGCSHGGLVEKGKHCFNSMYLQYGIVPSIEHYTCMVDILGRANRFDEAMALLECTPFSPNFVTWMSMLGACHKWKNVEMGRLAFQSLISFNDGDGVGYVLMGQIFASRGMFQEQEMILTMRKII